jgi:hypothetical protein
MSQDQRLKDLDDAGHAPRAASGNPEPGKQTLTDRATKDANSSSEIERLKKEVRDAYIGDDTFEVRGILDYKLRGIEDIKDELNEQDQNVGPDLLKTALSIGVAAAAGALAVSGIGTGVAASALIAGGAAAASALPDFVEREDGPTLNPIEFCSKYSIALSEKWPGSVNKLLGKMTTLDEARETHRDVLAIRGKPTEIRKNQMNEILDAWVNALKVATQKGTTSPAGMGTENFNDSTAGRLHIEGIMIDGRQEQTTFDISHLRAKLTDVPNDAKHRILDRKIGDINVARTIAGWGDDPLLSDVQFTARFAFGVHPRRTKDKEGNTFHILQYSPDETNKSAREQLKRIDGASSWQDGLTRIWDAIKGKTLSSLGVSSVGN